jgi:membrane protease YdiL (CAAX protease family)
MDARRKAIILLFLTSFLAVWLIPNHSLTTGLTYLSIIVVSILAYNFSKSIGITNLLAGISSNSKVDIVLGAVLGAGFIAVNLFVSSDFVIGVPYNPLATTESNYVTGSIVAPITEEIFFRGVVDSILNLILPPLASILVGALFFMISHYVAYGQAMSGAFAGAFIFALVAIAVKRWRKSILPVIIMHLEFNTFLLATKYMVGAVMGGIL